MYLLSSKKNFAQIFNWNFKDYLSFSLLAKKATKIFSNSPGELHDSSYKPFQLPESWEIFTPSKAMLDVKEQCQTYNHLIKAAEKLKYHMTQFSFFVPFLFSNMSPFPLYPPDLHTQILFSGIVYRKTDGKVTVTCQKDDPSSWQARRRGAFFTLLTWCWSLGCWCLVL